jgi:hypothetical protein
MQRGAYRREPASGKARQAPNVAVRRSAGRRPARSGGRPTATIAAVVAMLAVCGSAAARSAAGGPGAGDPGAGRPAGTGTGKPGAISLPRIQLRHGRSFAPALGDWEGTVDGFAASFELQYDTSLPARAGIPQYGLAHLVLLKPAACPRSPSSYSESTFSTGSPTQIGRFGSLGLARLGLGGSFTGGNSASLTAPYKVGSCHGKLAWHMHPARRLPVSDGAWTAHFNDGEQSSFRVQAGGRLASAIKLPRSLRECNGLQGAVDLFIGAAGRATLSTSGVTLALRFREAKGSGTLSARGCPASSVRVTAKNA